MIFNEGIINEDFLLPCDSPYYTLDIILNELARPATYQQDMLLHFYKPISYSLDTVFILDRRDARFMESIINGIIWSLGRSLEDLSEAISTMGLRLGLANATPEDLDLYWSKMLDLKRRYGESDEDFRARLTTRLAIMKSSGTKEECESIINHILGTRDAVRLDTYWPGEVRVGWKSPSYIKLAEQHYDAIKATLDEMLAAGISWSTSFPYIDYNIDMNMSGDKTLPYQADLGLEKPKIAQYLLRLDFFDQGTLQDDLDICLERFRNTEERIDCLLASLKAKLQRMDLIMRATASVQEQDDIILRARKSKLYEFDLLDMARKQKAYRLDEILARNKRSFYQIAMELTAS
ncbi:MAG: hypothetical protein A4E48_00287 [Methanosaeta sp. PtaU1.Bin060]|nr:MAG: hypothetical protein A4E48_00287 [Methanosaeta sp. PtaU1.Bin060]